MPINIQPIVIEIIVRFSRCGLSHREMLRITEVSQGDTSEVLSRVRHISSLTQRLCRHRLEMTTWKEDHVLLRIMKRNRFISASVIKVELIKRIRLCFFLSTIQRRFVVAGYCSSQPDRCPILPLTIAPCGTYWFTVTRTGTISTGLMWCLLMIWGLSLSLWSPCSLDSMLHLSNDKL